MHTSITYVLVLSVLHRILTYTHQHSIIHVNIIILYLFLNKKYLCQIVRNKKIDNCIKFIDN